ncbi:uncharacterized protein LOC113512091 [Galleria mellonella]|uniref:Uncharacterized protein LOC113512091 isoform X1 n=1 Tax=Galleria mellonella TaxID=7137 RepID=A0A6J1WDJ5_GALME|nr:uncharacterized protein LOC113512091 [Galleria mellonella]XP_026751668.1 uncharacterized protein LOC113512091 [Galleria mellonella]XP_031764906.1 uncharacterized protein LOC113512091 [Galleria mellonella]
MLSVKCVSAAVRLDFEDMSTLSVRAPGLQATTVLDARSLRARGVTTLESVRRNLFGCTDREENRRFVERELARQSEIDNQRWEYDFANDKPLPGAQRITWQLVPASSIPAVLRSAPITISPPTPSSTPQESKVVSSPENSKTQKRITDFMKTRKRLSNTGKKSPAHTHKHECGHGAHIRPPKVARLAQAHFKRSS